MTPQNQQQQQQISSVGGGAETVREQDKIQLVLAYIGILSLIPLLTVKDSEFVKWHAKQGLVLWIALTVVMTVLGFVPFLGLLDCVLLPAGIVFTIMGIMKSLKGERWRIPVIADLSEKF